MQGLFLQVTESKILIYSFKLKNEREREREVEECYTKWIN